MKAVVQRAPRVRDGSYEATSVYRNARKTLKPGESHIITVELCDDNVRRIRLAKKTIMTGEYMDRPMYVVESLYLCGRVARQEITYNSTKNEVMSMGTAAVPARTRDVLDFGRLEQSVQSLMTIMGKVQAEGSCTPEQYQAIVNSRAGIMEWRRKAREQMEMAETSIEMVEVMVRSLLDVPA